jgi:hypothetical protein
VRILVDHNGALLVQLHSHGLHQRVRRGPGSGYL